MLDWPPLIGNVLGSFLQNSQNAFMFGLVFCEVEVKRLNQTLTPNADSPQQSLFVPPHFVYTLL